MDSTDKRVKNDISDQNDIMKYSENILERMREKRVQRGFAECVSSHALYSDTSIVSSESQNRLRSSKQNKTNKLTPPSNHRWCYLVITPPPPTTFL